MSATPLAPASTQRRPLTSRQSSKTVRELGVRIGYDIATDQDKAFVRTFVRTEHRPDARIEWSRADTPPVRSVVPEAAFLLHARG